MLKFAIMAVVGALMLGLGIWSLRTRAYTDRISPIEAAILKTTGADPLPISAGDQAWGRAQAWLMVGFGSAILALGGFIVALSLFEAE
ncbi:hypothetical protein D1610_07560 [Sphingomonas gilva]|uniref:Uncharacterized protein n=1 Tax=Sphingomonas gilva TaxID=2305907 RepID=A0A396S4G6_9SPHN|nr:hypothetical protein [Sphingomonas gilva]RHW18315.1 hypothetical protein D1610_07560 [Sphingomonas gilva]